MCSLSCAARDARRAHYDPVSAGPAENALRDTGDAVAIGTHPPKHQQVPLATEVLTFSSSSFFKVFYLFILRERAGKEQRENPKQAPCCQHNPGAGLYPTNREIMT